MTKYFYLLICAGFVACQTQSTSQKDQSVANDVPLCRGVATITGMDDLAAPSFRDHIGNSHLTITTQSKEAQRWFDQGINLLHGFWHVEAYRAFRQVIKADSTCAMGYWGLAMCQPGFGGADNTIWTNAINKAGALKSKHLPLEKAFIEAGDVLVKQGIGPAQTPFRNLYKSYPNEPEAIAFASIILRQHQNEATQLEVKALLENALKRFPGHTGLQHYYVHVMELRPEFAKAKGIAEKMSKSAAHSPHLVHMPGHLYFLAGDYDKAVAVYTQARKQEYAYHTAEHIPLAANQNYLHNLHFLAVTQAERGDYEAALEAANQLANTTLSTTVPNEGAALMLLYEGRILPALVHIRFRNWQKADDKISFWLNSLDIPLTNPLVRTYLEAIRAYCRGMASLQTASEGQLTEAIEKATQQGGQLTQFMKAFEQQSLSKQNTPEFKSINETFDIMSMARYELAGWIDNMDNSKPFNDMAWKEALNLEKSILYDEPPRLMYPMGESLGRLHQYRNEISMAKQAYALALQKRPKSPMILRLMN